MWVTSGLKNESDVEQKFLYPFLVEPTPLGLGLAPSTILTKTRVRRLVIGKGAEQKSYYPDYLIVNMGFPLIVVEAKSPSEKLDDAYREARLYAAELNAQFPHELSPVQFVIACNGDKLGFGYADQAEPLSIVACEGLGVYSPDVSRMMELMNWQRVSELSADLARRIRPNELFKPRRLVGGLATQNEEVGQNSFGATLISAISGVFNPTTFEERTIVAANAYVSSKRRERYIDPIDRVIRGARPPSEAQSVQIEDSSDPREVIGKLQEPRALENKVLLLIGSVGSGKSTFIDHLIEIALPRELVAATVWARINMNAAPVTHSEIYGWLRREIVISCRASQPHLDFDDLAVLRKLYGVEIHRFDIGVGKLYKSDESNYSTKLGEHLERIQQDPHVVTNAHVRFTCAERGKLFVVVLDNCDKKTRDEQLLMFEAAQWLQKEFRCLVILPLRDETYDNHRDQPPLDTALKDLVFRIEPPLFQSVLMRRVHVAMKMLDSDDGEKLHFALPNGFSVEYPRSDQAFYLTSIVRSLFEYDRFARRMIVGLAGRNMRRALEIFLEFCNSGHIGEDQIFRIRQSEGRYTLPLSEVATVLLRMNRRFYDSDFSYIKNLFAANKDDPKPSFFCRYMILRWLRDNFRSPGPGALKGYCPKRDVKVALVPFGLEPRVLDREFNYLLAAQCVIAEHLRLDFVDDDDLVRLGPAGFSHLELIGNISYLAAVAEDTLFGDRLQAERVAERMSNPSVHLHVKSTLANASELVDYLTSIGRAYTPAEGTFLVEGIIEGLTDISEARDAIVRVSKTQAADPWFGADVRYLRQSIHDATIVNVTDFGYFAEFDDGLIGLIHRTYSVGFAPEIGDRVEVQIRWVDVIRRRMGLRTVAITHLEAGDVVPGVHGGEPATPGSLT